jgi:hypothetical protein
MPAGWYDDPFTDHLQRYWTGDSWTRETRPRPGAVIEPAPSYPAYPATAQTSAATEAAPGAPVRDWLIPSILAIIFCAWPLAIPGLVFALKANSSRKRGDMAAAAQQAGRAKFFVILSVAVGVVVWIYLGAVIAMTDMPTDQGTITPFGT